MCILSDAAPTSEHYRITVSFLKRNRISADASATPARDRMCGSGTGAAATASVLAANVLFASILERRNPCRLVIFVFVMW